MTKAQLPAGADEEAGASSPLLALAAAPWAAGAGTWWCTRDGLAVRTDTETSPGRRAVVAALLASARRGSVMREHLEAFAAGVRAGTLSVGSLAALGDDVKVGRPRSGWSAPRSWLPVAPGSPAAGTSERA